MTKPLRDLIAGAIFIVFALAFAVAASRYDLGTALRMGPGYFPLVLGGLLALLGVAILGEGLLRGSDDAPLGPIPWRALVLLSAGILFFGFAVRRLGLAPALFVAVLLAAFSSERTTIISAMLMALGLSVFCIFIFVELLGLPVPLLGPWLRF